MTRQPAFTRGNILDTHIDTHIALLQGAKRGLNCRELKHIWDLFTFLDFRGKWIINTQI